ncbi:hypothetical protein PR048_028422, partial [Dryococelus australis]
MESHYCISKSTKEYTEGGKSIADLHRDYLKLCNKPHVNYMMYATIFKEEFNISFHVPKKDLCDFCEGFRNAKESIQAICFIWHEGLANRGANKIATTKLDLVFYNDNCVGQNNNRLIFALYMHAVSALENVNSITYKFFIMGQTQNEGDAVHSVVEHAAKRFKRGSIYVPDNYVTIIKQAKESGKIFDVHEMCYTDIFDMKLLAEDLRVTDVFSNEYGDRVHVSGVSVVKTTNDNYEQLDYKTSYTQENFQTAKVLRNKRQSTAFKK